MKPGAHRISDIEVTLTDAGAVRNAAKLFQKAGIGVEAAVRMATETPARALGLDKKGRIEKGADADIVILNSDLEVQETIVWGETQFRRPT